MESAMKTIRRRSRGSVLLGTAAALCLTGAAPRAAAASFSEPCTVFYGKVLGTGSAQPFLITGGQLAWTITKSDGSTVTLTTSLYPYQGPQGNAFSYRLDVPHSAFALDLEPPEGAIPMPTLPQVNVHTSVKLDGAAAALLGPAGSAFTTEQLLRTAAYRLDLGVGRIAVDTDGDGIPDWWEDAYGLDKQDPSDATDDPNGDGVMALEAYLRGLDPAHDARYPAVLTRELVVYPSGTSGILLDVADSDSTAEQLTYTVTALPNAGTLTLRNAQPNPQNPDTVLAVGGRFTQADLLRGRVVYDRHGSTDAPGSFGVEVRDEDSGHPAQTAQILLLAFEPGDYAAESVTELESQRLVNHYYASEGFEVLDAVSLPDNARIASPSAGLTSAELADYRSAYGDDRRTLLCARSGSAWSLAGGLRADVLMAGQGNGTLTGGGDADVFVFRSFANGRVTVTDFSVPDGDVIDFSRLPASSGAYAHNYLKLVAVTNGYELRTDLDGNGSGYTNLTVALPGLAAADADLYTLVESGRLDIGALRLQPRVSVIASKPQASENGPVAGVFTIMRQGSLLEDLTVHYLLTGTAQNGVDYAYVPATATLPAGVASVDVAITPNADGVAEATETVQLVLADGTDYRIGTANQATVTIEERRMLVEIETLESLAVKDTLSPGLFVITRRDVIDRDVLVRLTIGGTASNGKDYRTVANFVYMAVNQTVAFVQITPLATATLSGGAETVAISIRSDAAYLVTGVSTAQVAIIEREDSFSDWYTREFDDASEAISVFAREDSGNTGVTHFERYAYGLDPHAPGSDGLPSPFVHQGRLAVTFRKPLGRNDLQYTLNGMTNLMNPAGSHVDMLPMDAPDGSRDPQRVYYVMAPAASNAPSAFVQVNAEWAP